MMNSTVKVMLFFLCFLPLTHGQKTRFGQEPRKAKAAVVYPLKVHISGVHVRSFCGATGCADAIYADAFVNGKKIDLRCSYIELPLGDYQARLKTNKQNADPSEIDQKYEIRFPDESVWQCRVAGYSE